MARPRKRNPEIDGELLDKLPPLPEAGSLNTIDDLQAEWQRLHRGRARRQIDADEFRDGLYSLQVGTPITRVREEIAQRERAIEALNRHETPESSQVGQLEFSSTSEPVQAGLPDLIPPEALP